MAGRSRDGTRGKMGTRKARHLGQIDRRAPWDEWVRLVEPGLPAPGCRGRSRIPG